MNLDDPKLTAFALDELDPSERAELEQLLRDDPAALAEIEEMRAVAAQLRTELHTEQAIGLAPSQRDQLVEKMAAAKVEASAERKIVRPSIWTRSWIPAAAAVVIVGIGLVGLWAVARYEMMDACIASSGISDPRPLDRSSANMIVAKLGDAILGKNVAEHLEPEPAPAADSGIVRNESAPIPSIDEVRSRALAQNLPAEQAPLPMPTGSLNKAGEGSLSPEREATEAKESQHFQLAAAPTKDQPALSPANPQPQTPPRSLREVKVAEMPKNLGSGMSKGLPSTMAGRAGPTARSQQMVNAPIARTITGKPMQFANVDELRFREGSKALRDGFRRDFDRSEGKPQMDAAERQTDAEAYDSPSDNPFLAVAEQPLSTFSIDVDTASYSNVRRFLNSNTAPPRDAVRIEELLNYFRYDYPQPRDAEPFSSTMEVATCPWAPEHRLVRIGLKGREFKRADRPAANLVFLIDVSGSMQPENKLPLLKQSMKLLVDQLDDRDSVAIVVYAGASGCALQPTHNRAAIREALDRLEAGGSTNGAAGIQLAYDIAQKSFIKGGTNRVILATDGDFNVGITDRGDLTQLIQKQARGGVFLSVLGFGMGNLKDATLESLADKGNGNYAYIDTLAEGRRVLVEQMAGTLFTIAKDVKIQVEFNPARVAGYRLIGYENRLLRKEDFNDDKKDAGEIGSGHTVTALYEIVPAGAAMPAPSVDALKYQPAPATAPAAAETRDGSKSSELLTLKLRFKAPDGDVSTLREFPLTDSGATWEKSSRDFRFAAAVASFGMLLRDSPHRGNASWDSTRELAIEGKGDDRDGYRAEFIGLIEKARAVWR